MSKTNKPSNLDIIKQIYILVPFYNEESHIVATYGMLSRQKLPFVFINDGSTDYTMSILDDIRKKVGGFDIVTYSTNKGKGFAIKEGAKYLIYNKNVDYILIFDSDGQNSISDIPNFLIALRKHPDAKIIIGNRLHSPNNIPLIRLLTNRFMSWLISCIAGQKITDTQCGMRLVHRDVFDLETKCSRFEYESEQLIKASQVGMNIISTPIKCIYEKNQTSKMNCWSDTIRFFKMIFRLLLV